MSAERAPMKRRTRGDAEDLAMNLPPGKTCADCVHCRRCTTMFGHIPADEVCDWYPSRFWATAKPSGAGANSPTGAAEP